MIKDKQIAELCGMTQRNLSCTYKRHKDPQKRVMYEVLKLGTEAYLHSITKQNNHFILKIDKMIKEQEKYILELKKLKDEIVSTA